MYNITSMQEAWLKSIVDDIKIESIKFKEINYVVDFMRLHLVYLISNVSFTATFVNLDWFMSLYTLFRPTKQIWRDDGQIT